jgi:hypothetical protein
MGTWRACRIANLLSSIRVHFFFFGPKYSKKLMNSHLKLTTIFKKKCPIVNGATIVEINSETRQFA